MSLINFLNPKLNPKVTSDTVHEDDYPPSNLISTDFRKQNQGFQSYGVCRQANLEFEFNHAIQVRQIKIWNSLGSLRSSGFDIYGEVNDVFEKVGHVNNFNGDCLMMCFPRNQNSTASSQAHERILFFKNAGNFLSDTKKVRIVCKSSGNTPPVLKKIEIWGFPSKSLSVAERNCIFSMWKSILNPDYGKKSPSPEIPAQSLSPSKTSEPNEKDDFEIPDDFLDSITFELMIFPTILPSGKIVDQSTIDKHSLNEANWGRSPSDPFTGVAFARGRQPILNLDLKARIEKFLLENSEHFKNVPRVLGKVRRSTKRERPRKSSSSPVDYSSLFDYDVPLKKQKKHKLDFYSPPCTVTSSEYLRAQCTPIDDAIEIALKKITKYSKPIPLQPLTKAENCINCNITENLYKILKCNHLVCRSCLNNFTLNKQCTCRVSFNSIDVEKYHKEY
ncbi:UBOX5 family protein [Megaselia abdita]